MRNSTKPSLSDPDEATSQPTDTQRPPVGKNLYAWNAPGESDCPNPSKATAMLHCVEGYAGCLTDLPFKLESTVKIGVLLVKFAAHLRSDVYLVPAKSEYLATLLSYPMDLIYDHITLNHDLNEDVGKLNNALGPALLRLCPIEMQLNQVILSAPFRQRLEWMAAHAPAQAPKVQSILNRLQKLDADYSVLEEKLTRFMESQSRR